MNHTMRTTLAFLLLSVTAFAAQAVAFISDIRGEVAVDGNPRPMLLSELTKGQKVTVSRESQASVMFIASGKEYILKGPGDYMVKDTEISGSIMPPVSRGTDWRANPRVLSQVAQTSAASVRMRSLAVPKVEAPKPFPAEGAVASLQPVFRWSADAPAADFTLHVVGQDKAVHQARAVAGGSYRLPAKLRPESEYTWSATAAGSEVGSGKFRTLSAPALARLDKQRPAERAEFSDRLHFALLLVEMGAAQEAREAWDRLAKERADLPELAGLAR